MKQPEFINTFFNKDVLQKLQELQSRTNEVSKRIYQIMEQLAVLGWYVNASLEVGTITGLAQDLGSGNTLAITKKLQSHYGRNFDTIIEDLCKSYPVRRKIFEQAAKAHKMKLYYASISLFLSQADGICNGHLFILKNEKRNLRKEVKKFNNSILEEVLEVLMKESAIDAPYSKGPNYPSALNRHRVFHGLDLEYGTLENSFKALSLLTFVGDFFDRYNSY